MFSPFSDNSKKGEDVIEQNITMDSLNNMSQNALPQGATDEQLFLEQQKEREDLIKWQQDLEPEVIKLICHLRGVYIDENGDLQKKKGIGGNPVQPMCNEEGIRVIETLASTNTSKNIIMSNYTDEKIGRELLTTTTTLIRHLGPNYKMYGIDKKDLSVIVDLYKKTITPTYYRALQNGERRHLGTINKRIETISEHSQPKKKQTMWSM